MEKNEESLSQLQSRVKKYEEQLALVKSEGQKKAQTIKSNFEELAKRLVKVEVQTETNLREIDLMKVVRRQLQDKMGAQFQQCQEAVTKMNFQSQQYKDTQLDLEKKFTTLKAYVEDELKKMREPLDTEMKRLTEENALVLKAFDVQKDEYRELSGGFLSIINMLPLTQKK